jgi:flagellin
VVQVAIHDSSLLRGVSPRAADADVLASLARAAATSRGFAATIGGISVRSDRLEVASAGRYAAEAAALAAALGNARYAAGLAQTASEALDEIDAKLARLEQLAAAAREDTASYQERLRLDLEFQSLKADIDRLATAVRFDGAALLGGDGAGGAFTLTLRVGSGADASADEITISISAATVAELSGDLATDTLTTAAAAQAAEANAAAAREALGVRRGEVAGGLARAAAAGLVAEANSNVAERTRRELVSPQVAVDFSRLVAERAADEGGVHLFDGAEQQLKNLLIRLGRETDAVIERGESMASKDRSAGGRVEREEPPRDVARRDE